MTDNEIIKALRLCADKGCYHCTEYGKVYCRETIASLSWDLINRQKAEIERLKMDLAKCSIRIDNLYETADEIKSEAIKEFVDRFEKEIETTPNVNAHFRFALLRYAKQIKDNLVK